MKNSFGSIYAIILLFVFGMQLAYAQEASRSVTATDIEAFIKVVPSKTLVHLSDTLSLSFLLYTTHQPNRVLRSDFSPITDFYSTAVRPQMPMREELVNGIKYKVIELRRVILQPKKEGIFSISAGTVLLEYDFPTGRKARDFWGRERELVHQVRKDLSIEATTIKVHDMIAV